jgi:hypothetical protein
VGGAGHTASAHVGPVRRLWVHHFREDDHVLRTGQGDRGVEDHARFSATQPRQYQSVLVPGSLGEGRSADSEKRRGTD